MKLLQGLLMVSIILGSVILGSMVWAQFSESENKQNHIRVSDYTVWDVLPAEVKESAKECAKEINKTQNAAYSDGWLDNARAKCDALSVHKNVETGEVYNLRLWENPIRFHADNGHYEVSALEVLPSQITQNAYACLVSFYKEGRSKLSERICESLSSIVFDETVGSEEVPITLSRLN